MFAIIETGGKQYRAEPNAILTIEKLEGKKGDEVIFDRVLLVTVDEKTVVGQPVVNDAVVKAKIINQTKGAKVIIFKKKRRKNYRKKVGHRQPVTGVMIQEIVVPSL